LTNARGIPDSQSVVVTVCPLVLTLKKFTFCPHSASVHIFYMQLATKSEFHAMQNSVISF